MEPEPLGLGWAWSLGQEGLRRKAGLGREGLEARAWKTWSGRQGMGVGGMVELISVETLFSHRLAFAGGQAGVCWGWILGVGCGLRGVWDVWDGVLSGGMCPFLHAFAIDKET